MDLHICDAVGFDRLGVVVDVALIEGEGAMKLAVLAWIQLVLARLLSFLEG